MALSLNYRERRLLEAFRSCDERGKAVVEAMAEQRTAASATAALQQARPRPVQPARVIQIIRK